MLDLDEEEIRNLNEIDLSDSDDLQPSDLAELFQIIARNPLIKKLKFSDCGLNSDFAIELARHLQASDNSVEEIVLVFNAIGNPGLKALMDVDKLKVIKISGNNITDEITEEVLKRDKNRPIFLDGNKLSQKRMKEIETHFGAYRDSTSQFMSFQGNYGQENVDPETLAAIHACETALALIHRLPDATKEEMKRKFSDAFGRNLTTPLP